MKTKRILVIPTLLIALAALTATGIFRGTHPVQAESEASMRLVMPRVPLASPAPTPNYTVKPSNTDGHPAVSGDQPDCPGLGIGCKEWGDYAPNEPHALSVPASKNTGKLLVFFPGVGGNPAGDFYHGLYHTATLQGYHVIGLTYFTKLEEGGGAVGTTCKDDMSCYEKFMREVIDGSKCGSVCGKLDINDHPQDSIVSRLLNVLRWARAEYPDDGWDRYLTPIGPGETVNWDEVHLAGFSNGSGYAALMGILVPRVKRVSLFAGPNDGKGDSDADWVTAEYIQPVPGVTDTHYFGLVHELNKATHNGNTSTLYKVTKAWRAFGMGTPDNPPRVEFDPHPNNPYFYSLGARMFISTDPGTLAAKAHTSIIRDEYLDCEGMGDTTECLEGSRIGYEPAWRCVLGIGDELLNSKPVADAGPNQTVECQGGGGADVTLDGSASRDVECDVLSYAWSGPFGLAARWNPTVFLPLGSNAVTLSVRDSWGWWSSSSDSTVINVVDTKPPSVKVTLIPNVLPSANHDLVRIGVAVSATDKCDSSPIDVVLTSITSSEPDSGAGPGDIAGDIQKARFGSPPSSFLLRAEGFGRGRRARTYTVTYTATDARGNSTETSATIFVERGASR